MFSIFVVAIPKPPDHREFNANYVDDTVIGVPRSQFSWFRPSWIESKHFSAHVVRRPIKRKRKGLRSVGHNPCPKLYPFYGRKLDERRREKTGPLTQYISYILSSIATIFSRTGRGDKKKMHLPDPNLGQPILDHGSSTKHSWPSVSTKSSSAALAGCLLRPSSSRCRRPARVVKRT